MKSLEVVCLKAFLFTDIPNRAKDFSPIRCTNIRAYVIMGVCNTPLRVRFDGDGWGVGGWFLVGIGDADGFDGSGGHLWAVDAVGVGIDATGVG